MDETPQTEWNYERLYNKIASYVLESEPVRAVLLFDALAKREGADVQTGLCPREWDWLQWNLGLVKKVVNSTLMPTMMFLTHKSGWASFSIRDVAKRTGSDEGLVCRYARQLESKGVLRRHRLKYDRKVYYIACSDLPTISKILVELILMRYGLVFFEEFLKPSEEKAIKHARALRKLNERVKRHYRLRGRAGSAVS